MKPATADLTRVSMLAPRRGGTSVGRCAAPRLPLPGWPPSSAALVDDSLDGGQREAAAEREEVVEEEEKREEVVEEEDDDEEDRRWLEAHSFRAEVLAVARIER